MSSDGGHEVEYPNFKSDEENLKESKLVSSKIIDSSEPHTESGNKMSINKKTTPTSLFCHEWHPTHVEIKVGTKKYLWNSRSHRKIRLPESLDRDVHPSEIKHRLRLLSWEPKIISWHICWIGFIANTMWVVNGIYATWPDAASNTDPDMISYVTGIIGAFLFILTGYLGYVEAINHTHSEVRVPMDETVREYVNPSPQLGFWGDPINSDVTFSDKRQALLIDEGYPLLEDVESEQMLSSKVLDLALEKFGDAVSMEKAVLGRELIIRLGNHVIRADVTGFEGVNASNKSVIKSNMYRWWTWYPDLHYLGVFNALVFFIATLIFFIPACAWYPMDEKGANIPKTIFWVYVLQIIPSIGFVYVGHAAMAEAAGSWIKPRFNSIGWWISFFNTVGGYGFLLCPILAIPSVVGEVGCCDELTKWGSLFSTFWGSCAFWVAGVLQCVEFSSEHPINFSKDV